MTEEKVVEAELNDSTMSDVSDAIAVIVDETVKVVDSLGKALVTTLQDISNLMMHLDLLVDAGVAKSRSKAAAQLIEEGIAVTEVTFDRIRRTQAQIGELRRLRCRAAEQISEGADGSTVLPPPPVWELQNPAILHVGPKEARRRNPTPDRRPKRRGMPTPRSLLVFA